jgi:cytochrome c553
MTMGRTLDRTNAVIAKMAALAFILLIASACAARAETAMVRNCTWCHGGSAQGYPPAPRLAGQRPNYIYQQLAGFAHHTRDAPFSKQYMWGAAANLSPTEAHALSVYFANLPARSANDGNRALVPLGEAIYQRGMPEENVAACVACHGPNGEGIGAIPRLGGLDYPYLRRRLLEWAEGYHGTLDHPMPHIAAQLSRDQIEALASYLSFVGDQSGTAGRNQGYRPAPTWQNQAGAQ